MTNDTIDKFAILSTHKLLRDCEEKGSALERTILAPSLIRGLLFLLLFSEKNSIIKLFLCAIINRCHFY